MIAHVLSLLLPFAAMDSTVREISSLLEFIRSPHACKDTIPPSPGSLPSSIRWTGGAKIRTSTCRGDLRKTLVTWGSEESSQGSDLYLVDSQGLAFLHSYARIANDDGSEDSLVDHWLYRSPHGAIAYSSVGMSTSPRTAIRSDSLANIADRIFWEGGLYRSISDTLARTIGLPKGFSVVPPSGCIRTSYPQSTARGIIDRIAPWMDLRTDSAYDVLALESHACGEAMTFLLAQTQQSGKNAQLTLVRQHDSLRFAVVRETSNGMETERLLVPGTHHASTWIRTAGQIDAIYPFFVKDSAIGESDSLASRLSRSFKLPDPQEVFRIRRDSADAAVQRRIQAIDEAIRLRKCIRSEANPIPELTRLVRSTAPASGAEFSICPDTIGTLFVQHLATTTRSFEQRIYATTTGMELVQTLRKDTSGTTVRRRLFRFGNTIASLESTSHPSKNASTFQPTRSPIDTRDWGRIDSAFLASLPNFPRQAIALDGFLFLEANPEVSSELPAKRVGPWNVTDLRLDSVQERWRSFQKKVFRSQDDPKARPDTIVGFCLISAVPEADEESSPRTSNDVYLVAKLSGKRKIGEAPDLVGLASLLPAPGQRHDLVSSRFDEWSNQQVELAKTRAEALYQTFLQQPGNASNHDSQYSPHVDPYTSSWSHGDGQDEYFFHYQSVGLGAPCVETFDGSFAIATHRAVPTETPLRDVFAPSEPDLPTPSETDAFEKIVPYGMESIEHPCSGIDGYECGIQALSRAKPGRHLQALVEAQGDFHKVLLREWNGSEWETRMEVNRPGIPQKIGNGWMENCPGD
ncbi:MAG: hypothetical protein IPN71_19880 [Fibrobacteres bacterium]|jgi:hypothetical protein|nr:hypothetical protein [Fibrobacterota bacterium]